MGVRVSSVCLRGWQGVEKTAEVWAVKVIAVILLCDASGVCLQKMLSD